MCEVFGRINKWVLNKNIQETIPYKIPKISPGAYIFQRPFLGGFFVEGLILIRKGLCTEENLRFKIEWTSL